MATVNQILDLAAHEVGMKENPPNSNMTPYGKEYGWNGVPWCAIFVWVIFNRAGASALLPAKTASCWALMDAAKKAGLWVEGNYRKGDVVIFDFPGGASTDHTGIVEDVEPGYVTTIEGNTSIGNDSNGGQVMRRRRSIKLARGAVRPKYDADKRSVFLIAQEVLNGKWGNGDARREKLNKAGYNPAEVQGLVNKLSTGKLRAQIVVTSTLNIRKEPTDKSKILDVFGPGVIVTVEEIREGPGASCWGRVGTGWISMDWVKVV